MYVRPHCTTCDCAMCPNQEGTLFQCPMCSKTVLMDVGWQAKCDQCGQPKYEHYLSGGCHRLGGTFTAKGEGAQNMLRPDSIDVVPVEKPDTTKMLAAAFDLVGAVMARDDATAWLRLFRELLPWSDKDTTEQLRDDIKHGRALRHAIARTPLEKH